MIREVVEIECDKCYTSRLIDRAEDVSSYLQIHGWIEKDGLHFCRACVLRGLDKEIEDGE